MKEEDFREEDRVLGPLGHICGLRSRARGSHSHSHSRPSGSASERLPAAPARPQPLETGVPRARLIVTSPRGSRVRAGSGAGRGANGPPWRPSFRSTGAGAAAGSRAAEEGLAQQAASHRLRTRGCAGSYLKSGTPRAEARRPPRRPGCTAAAAAGAPSPGPCRGQWGPGRPPNFWPGRGVGRHHPFLPRVLPSSPALLKWVHFEDLVVVVVFFGPGCAALLQSRRGLAGEVPGRGLGRPAGRQDERGGRTAGGRAGGRVPARPPRWAERGLRQRPLPGERAGGGRDPGSRGRSWGPGPASRARPRACASERLNTKVAPWGRQPELGGSAHAGEVPRAVAPDFRGETHGDLSHKSVTPGCTAHWDKSESHSVPDTSGEAEKGEAKAGKGNVQENKQAALAPAPSQVGGDKRVPQNAQNCQGWSCVEGALGSAVLSEATAAFGLLLKANCIILPIKGRTLFVLCRAPEHAEVICFTYKRHFERNSNSIFSCLFLVLLSTCKCLCFSSLRGRN